MRPTLRWPPIIFSSGVGLAFLLSAQAGGAVTAVLAAWFLFVCTGMSFAPLLGIESRAFELAAGVVLSIVLDALVATVLLLLGALSLASGLIALLALAGVGCLLQLLEPPSPTATSTAPPWRW